MIEKLTCGHINGEPTRGDRVNENPSSSYTVDRYLKRKFKVSISNIQVLNQYILQSVKSLIFTTGTRERFKRSIE